MSKLYLTACFHSILFLILLSQETFCQTLTDLNEKLDSVDLNLNIQNIETLNSKNIVQKEYYDSGQIKSLITYKDCIRGMLHGEYKTWYNNGTLKRENIYSNGKFEGELKTYWQNGVQKRIDKFEKGKFLSGKCFNIEGNEIPHFDFEIMPEYVGGVEGMRKFLAQNMSYPAKARKKNIQGKVHLTFLINKDGSISNIKILKGVHPLIDKEALRVVRKMPLWKPAMQDGEPLKIQFNLPVTFILK